MRLTKRVEIAKKILVTALKQSTLYQETRHPERGIAIIQNKYIDYGIEVHVGYSKQTKQAWRDFIITRELADIQEGCTIIQTRWITPPRKRQEKIL